MNENLDLTKILDGCPSGTEFYSTIFGKVSLMRVYNNIDLPIVIVTDQGLMGLTSDGRYFSQYDGECTLFPSKEQRDWSKFERFWDKEKAKEPIVEMFDEYTLKPFDKVLVRDNIEERWKAMFFSHIVNYIDIHRAICGYYAWEQCIPYNDETKHLVGTKEDCPEFYKWWED